MVSSLEVGVDWLRVRLIMRVRLAVQNTHLARTLYTMKHTQSTHDNAERASNAEKALQSYEAASELSGNPWHVGQVMVVACLGLTR